MAAVLVALILVVITATWAWLKYRLGYWSRRGIPHLAPGSLILGNMAEFPKTKHISEILRETYDAFKSTGIPYAGFYFVLKTSVVILDLDLAKNILIKDFQNFRARGLFYNERDDPLTGNLFFLDGEKWTRIRHFTSPTFTSGKMKLMYAAVARVGKELVTVLTEKIEQGEQVIEMVNLVGRYTADVIGCCAFGLECNSLRDPEADFVRIGRRFVANPRHTAIIDGLIHSFPKIARKLQMRIIDQEAHDFYMRIVRETISYREQHNIKCNDFMDLLIELKNEKSSDGQDNLTVEEVAAQAAVFFIAGFETSSTTMGFALYELAQHQDIQNKVREEINSVMDILENELLTYDCMKAMTYLGQVIDETMRLHPIVPHLVREASERYETSDPKYYIDKGTFILIPVIGYHHDPEIFPDPEKFQPDRFSPESVKNRHICAFLPFGEGPRNCIGARFGKMQMFTGLAYLLRNFRFTLATETQVPYKLVNKNILLNAESIKLKVEKIKK